MGQAANVVCSFGTLHLCEAEDGQSGALVLPSRCSGATSSTAVGRINKIYNLDFTNDSLFLGHSAFSTAFRAAHRATHELRVVRAIPKRRCERERMVRELEILRGLDHPNLARVCEVFEDPRMLWLVMELAPGEDLLSAVASAGKRLSDWLVAHLARQLLLGLQHLHSAGVAHEDVQPRNILVIDGPPGQDLRLKLIDYGLATKYAKGTPVLQLQCCYCLAPEQVHGSISPRTSCMEPSCDLWAVGAITFLLLSGFWPLEADNPQLLRKKIRTGLWSFLPNAAWEPVGEHPKEFVSSLLTVHTSQRPSAAQALQHAFLQPPDALNKPSLQPLGTMSKFAPQPMSRFQEVKKSVQKISAQWFIHYTLVKELATKFHAVQLEELRQHFFSLDPMTRGYLTFDDLRHGLVQAGVVLPGRLLNAVVCLDGGKTMNIKIEDLIEAAAERRRGLEEVLLWGAWSIRAPEAHAFLTKDDVGKVLEQGSSAFSHILGISLNKASWSLPAGNSGAAFSRDSPIGEQSLSEQASFDQLLTWLRNPANANARRGIAPSFNGHWIHAQSYGATPQELQVRMPPQEAG